MPEHNNFRKNLKFAQKGEQEALELYLTKYPNSTIINNLNNTKEYDFLIETDSIQIPIEVKEDRRVKTTNNVVIEFESWGKPSAIETTKSTYWIMRLHNNQGIESLMFKVEDIKKAISNKEYSSIRKMKFTDSKNQLYFFTKEDFLSIPHINLDN
jgi:hypothetical protein